jgi:hypothetical protein
MSMPFTHSLDHISCPGCHSEEKRLCNDGELVQWYISLAPRSTSLTFCSQECSITYRYGLSQASDGIHFLEDDGITDFLASEEGDCNVSEARHLISRMNLSAEGSWTCSGCGASNSNLTPDMCPICGYKR